MEKNKFKYEIQFIIFLGGEFLIGTVRSWIICFGVQG